MTKLTKMTKPIPNKSVTVNTIRLYKTVKVLQVIFNLYGFAIEGRIDWKYLTVRAVTHYVRSETVPNP
jgi:hypothetical protein